MEQNKTFKDLITSYSFVIPDYQRAYSWGEKQLIPFINDILEHCDDNNDSSDDTTYYLGHFILENSKYDIANIISADEYNRIRKEGFSISCDKYEIVDGQQRISTVYFFLLVCGYLKKENYINEITFSPVSYDLPGLDQIKSILNNSSDVNGELEKLMESSKTASQKRMIEAVLLFIKSFSSTSKIDNLLNVENIEKYIQVINNAYCSVAIFNNKSVASQIFELHNTRGIKLTETEKVKALLMKTVYINSTKPDSDIKEIQEEFSRIFELEEEASEVWLRGDLPLDTILMYHLRAVEDGKKIKDFSFPQGIEGERGSFEYVRKSISEITSKDLIVDYAKNLAKEFAITMEIIVKQIPDTDKQNPLVGDVLLLDKNKSLIFLLRAFRSGNSVDNKLIERWENFVLCYDIIYWNGFFYGKKYRDNFETIYASLKPHSGFDECKSLLSEYYNGKLFGAEWGHLGENTKKLFSEGKSKWISSTYNWHRTGYFLYKYETFKGADLEEIRKNIFKGDTVSIDHIVARGLSFENLGFPNYDKLLEDDELKQQANVLWKRICGVINGIGNLALSTASNNSSDSNKLPNEHIDTYNECGLVETVEQVKTWENPQEFDLKINKRSEDIIKFISEKIVNRNDIWE